VAVRIGERAGEQDQGSLGEAGEDPALLLADQAPELFVDRHERLAAHLVVLIAQVRSSVTILDDAVEGKFQRIGHSQAAADQDSGRQLVGRIVEALEVGGTLHLGDHVLRQRPWQLLGALWVVLGIEGCSSRKRQVPAVVADCLEELAQEPDVAAVRGAACELGGKVGQVLLQHGPVDISQSLEAQRCALEEAREASERANAPGRRGGSEPGAEAPPQPSFGELPQPRLGDAVEVEAGGRTVTGWIAEVVQTPDVAGDTRFPIPGRRQARRAFRARR
jgi:hypothetical protein